jgi:hypothetical protein
MLGLWDKNDKLEYQFVDSSIFYFEASFSKQYNVINNGTSNLISTM